MTAEPHNQPYVSILMAVHNGEPYLREAIQSLLRQTYKNFELIIIDDGSSDESPGVIQEFAAADGRVKLINNGRNMGLVASLNRGLFACRAELVARADADDVFSPERIQTQVEFMESNPEVGVVGSAVEFIDQDGTRIDRQLHDFPINPADVRLHSLLGCCLWHTTVMFRKSLVSKAGGYNPEFVGGPEDYDLWATLLDVTKIANQPLPLAQQRLHGGSVTAGWSVGFKLYCSVAQRLLERYLGRSVSLGEATALVSLCGCDGNLSQIDCTKGFQILRETLLKAASIEARDVCSRFRQKCGNSLLRQAGFNVYSQKILFWKLMREACRTSPKLIFAADLWLNFVRALTPAAVRAQWKRI